MGVEVGKPVGGGVGVDVGAPVGSYQERKATSLCLGARNHETSNGALSYRSGGFRRPLRRLPGRGFTGGFRWRLKTSQGGEAWVRLRDSTTRHPVPLEAGD